MPTLPEILGNFESLGDNCEFGIVQRFAGIEPLGLFRLNFARLPSLLRALDSDFDGIDDLELVIEPDTEYMVRVRGYDFRYHSEKFVGQIAPAELLTQQVRAVRFLARKLREDMAAAEKIFVRKGEDSQTEADIDALHRALRRHGPVTLLWVVQEDREHRSGTVETLRDGLMKAYIDRFASTGDVHNLSIAWYEIMRHAHALWRGGCLPGTVIARADHAAASNGLPGSDTFEAPGWRTGEAARSAASHAVPRLHADSVVVEHVLTRNTDDTNQNVHFHYVPGGLVAGDLYVGSIHVWIPAEFAGSSPGAVFEGFSSVGMQHADLRFRAQWQRVWVVARLPDALDVANLALVLRAPEGARIYSTCWQLERGTQPGRYVPGSARPVAVAALSKAAM